MAGEAAGDLEAVHRMHPVEVPGDQGGLVGLNPADEVPAQRQASQRLGLGGGLLGVVLAEVELPGVVRFGNGGGGLGLGNGDQGDALRGASVGAGGAGDALAHRAEVAGNAVMAHSNRQCLTDV